MHIQIVFELKLFRFLILRVCISSRTPVKSKENIAILMIRVVVMYIFELLLFPLLSIYIVSHVKIEINT